MTRFILTRLALGCGSLLAIYTITFRGALGRIARALLDLEWLVPRY